MHCTRSGNLPSGGIGNLLDGGHGKLPGGGSGNLDNDGLGTLCCGPLKIFHAGNSGNLQTRGLRNHAYRKNDIDYYSIIHLT